MSRGQAPLDSFSTGTLAGAGCFRCGTCGFAVALHERDEVPACPHCGGEDFRRSSIFGELEPRQPDDAGEVECPDWLGEARDALEHEGDYLAYDDDGQLRVVGLERGWTRIGRSLAADVRFDHPTVSRRHAMVHRGEDVARVLDDRSLNGVFVNGERVDMRTLSDGDEVTIGRFRLYFLSLSEAEVRDRATDAPRALA
jgi:predicted  nucleic acid-binding Zn-ribbon protein